MVRKYFTFNYRGRTEGKTLLTGIRKQDCTLYITGFYEPSSSSVSYIYKEESTSSLAISFLYIGTLKQAKKNEGTWIDLSFHGKNTNLYGPNYVPERELIQTVGNYFTGTNDSVLLGCLYQTLYESNNQKQKDKNQEEQTKGKWTIIVPPFGNSTLNTICHSVNGGLVVGNYDTTENSNISKAFIYDIYTSNYYDIVIPNMQILSISAYGIILKNKEKEKKIYTICGGYIERVEEGSKAYMVDFDLKKKRFTNFRSFSYPIKTQANKPSFVTHFDGISYDEKKDKYYLTGDYSNPPCLSQGCKNQISKEIGNLEGAFVATVEGKGEVKWETLSYMSPSILSGNSIAKDIVVGVYATQDNTYGYISYT